MQIPSMNYAVREGNRTIALFIRRHDAREFVANLNYEEARLDLRILKLTH